MQKQSRNIVMVKAANKGVEFNEDGLLNTIQRKVVNGKSHEFRSIRKHIVDKQVTRVKAYKNFIKIKTLTFCASQFIPRRHNIFDSNHMAPYSRRVKPLDRNFRIRLQSENPAADVIFYGYLPWELSLNCFKCLLQFGVLMKKLCLTSCAWDFAWQ